MKAKYLTSRQPKKRLVLFMPYIFIGLSATKLCQAWRIVEGADASQKFLHYISGLQAALSSPMPSFHPIDLLFGVAVAVALRVAVHIKGQNARKFRKNMEYGSARWGTAEDIAPFIGPVFRNNIILTQTERLTMSNRPKDPAYARNNNVLVIGGSGSGKTRYFVLSNLLQCHSSYVVTDPKGDLINRCGTLLQKKGYRIKVLNTINFSKSMKYNPLSYINSEKDILKLVNTLILNTKGDGQGGDPFWIKSETLLLTALIGYMHYHMLPEEQNFSMLLDMLNMMEVKEEDENYRNPIDLLFDDLKSKDPHDFAVRQYTKYRLAAGKTAKSILVSVGARLAPFDIQELRELTAYDELELDTLGDRKTALFIIMSDTDSTFNFMCDLWCPPVNVGKVR